MAKDIGPGSLVKCLKAPQEGRLAWSRVPNWPTVGRIYTVRNVIDQQWSQTQSDPAYLLVEVVNPPQAWATGEYEVGFWAEWFTPVDDDSIQIFRDLAQPVRDKVGA